MKTPLLKSLLCLCSAILLLGLAEQKLMLLQALFNAVTYTDEKSEGFIAGHAPAWLLQFCPLPYSDVAPNLIRANHVVFTEKGLWELKSWGIMPLWLCSPLLHASTIPLRLTATI